MRMLFRSFAPSWATLLLLTVAIPSKSLAVESNAFDYDFRTCGEELARAGIPDAVISEACSGSLYPRELTTCVLTIYRQTDISPEAALSSCRQVRRPRELGNCVANISLNTTGGSPGAILDNCRRSLLPNRFGECVVGLVRSLNAAVAPVMANCIDGSDRPQDFYPPGAYPLQEAPPQPPLIVPAPTTPLLTPSDPTTVPPLPNP
ncbi:hypothetical protein ACE1B6_03130 [Aerosakkonemataceae cyanobacterium BLCC-F154]|uniref:Uncharacterized protein n=1 Tax=Floridaenema fluviatile BLCC-F154 TaxID=3153640 RepID=A0ABV4Y666_9CYAN